MPLPRPPQILGGCFALYDSTFDPDNTGWQVASIVPYFFYSMAYPAIGIMLFKAHRDKANHMLRVLTVLWVGNFLTKGGSATPLGFLPLIGTALYIGGLLIYMPIVIGKIDVNNELPECGRSYAAFFGMTIGAIMPIQLEIATLGAASFLRASVSVRFGDSRAALLSLSRAPPQDCRRQSRQLSSPFSR